MLLPLTTAQMYVNTGANILKSMICCDFASCHCTGYVCCIEDVV